MGFVTLIFVFSVLMNLYLLVLLAAQLDAGFATETILKGAADQTIAVYAVTGIIDEEAAQRFSRFYDEVRTDDEVKAIVLRVSSPGGGVTASDQIHHLVKQLDKQGKPVVVSMGGVAASGGYYISAPAREIIAEPTTVTGSIGVIIAWPVLRGTLDKLGIEMVVMKSTHAQGWKDEANWVQPPAPRHREHLQEILDEIQAKFEEVVIKGRGGRLKTRKGTYTVTAGKQDVPREVEETEPFNGKVYLAAQAKQLGLIDAIGYVSQATDRAAVLAGLQNPRVVRYAPRQGLLAELIRGQNEPLLSLSAKNLDEFQTPRILLMWKAE